jgi:hypothetical protein
LPSEPAAVAIPNVVNTESIVTVLIVLEFLHISIITIACQRGSSACALVHHHGCRAGGGDRRRERLPALFKILTWNQTWDWQERIVTVLPCNPTLSQNNSGHVFDFIVVAKSIL